MVWEGSEGERKGKKKENKGLASGNCNKGEFPGDQAIRDRDWLCPLRASQLHVSNRIQGRMDKCTTAVSVEGRDRAYWKKGGDGAFTVTMAQSVVEMW